ncbi:paratose synthase [Cellvibrio zantedeschiae]|uniref:Paratose synthase n=1 Tax=Cellvibrio zantedeschiae TaxID=1237077 RepID=A0ABQ3AS73_9GAMM|nr:NAD(P)-dependent oxidoreductase [Cellvibrio zantedeschiae]GGY62931.1 paratose synthase [Cellvibrio zantedeschiae]
MRYLISGATGFIGSNLVAKLLDNGNQIFLITRTSRLDEEIEKISKENIFFFDGNEDALDEFLKKNVPDIFIHLASLYITQHKKEDVTNLLYSNITYPTIITDAIVRCGCKKIINTGTSWQNFNNEKYNPTCLYAATKEAFEKLLEFYVKSQSINVITLRIFDTYGLYDKRKKLVSMLVESSKQSLQIEMSPGEQEIDLVYVDDVVDAFLVAIELILKSPNSSHLTYGISSEKPITLKKLVDILNSISPQKLKVKWGARDYRDREVMYTWKDFIRLPNWKPKVSIEEGLRKLVTSSTDEARIEKSTTAK